MDRLTRRRLNRHRARCGSPLAHLDRMPEGWAVVAYMLTGPAVTLPHFAPRAHAFPVAEATRRARAILATPPPARYPGSRWTAWLHVGPKGRRVRIPR